MRGCARSKSSRDQRPSRDQVFQVVLRLASLQTAPEAAAYAPHRGPRSREACPQPSRCATTRTPSRQRGRRASGAARTQTLRAAAPARRRAMAPQAKARTYHAPRAGAKHAYGSPRCGPHRLWRSETLLKAAACCAFRSCVHLVAFGLGLPAPWQPGAQIVFFFSGCYASNGVLL